MTEANAGNADRASTPLPSARLQPQRGRERGTLPWAWIWMLPVLALLFSAWLLTEAWRERGPTLTLHFSQGYGLKPGDALRYRGIAVGTVEKLWLDDTLDGVSLTLRLEPRAAALARAGSRFWIVRPRLEVGGLRGLDTVIGANYINVLPGSPGNPRQSEFVGLEQPPPREAIEPGGLEIVLTAPGKGNLKPGAPISYRQVIVGTILTVDLAKDATAVEARAYIDPDYTNLIRRGVRFWRSSGARVSAGLGGLSVAVDSVHSLILGGINLAIPPQPGPRVEQNASFPLHDKPDDDWLQWTPGLSLYNEAAGDTLRRPPLLPAELTWSYRNWMYLSRDAARSAWLLPLRGALLGPADTLTRPAQASDGSVRLRIDDELVPAPPPPRPLGDGLALAVRAHRLPAWPLNRLRRPALPEDTLIVIPGEGTPRYVGADRYRIAPVDDDPLSGQWLLDPALPFSRDWHGAAVLAESDGALLGLLLVGDDDVRLARADPAALEAVLPTAKPASAPATPTTPAGAPPPANAAGSATAPVKTAEDGGGAPEPASSPASGAADR